MGALLSICFKSAAGATGSNPHHQAKRSMSSKSAKKKNVRQPLNRQKTTAKQGLLGDSTLHPPGYSSSGKSQSGPNMERRSSWGNTNSPSQERRPSWGNLPGSPQLQHQPKNDPSTPTGESKKSTIEKTLSFKLSGKSDMDSPKKHKSGSIRRNKLKSSKRK